MHAVVDFLKNVGLSFIPLFVAVDAIGNLPFILAMTHDMDAAGRQKVIQYAMLTAFLLGVVFVALGQGIFYVLGIEVADFLVAGGVILLILTIRHFTTGKLVELQPDVPKIMIGVVPIGTPLIVGPAVLTTLLILTQRYSIPIVLVAFLLNLGFAWLLFAQANRVARLMREQGLRIASQIASLFLAVIAVMMIREGVLQMVSQVK